MFQHYQNILAGSPEDKRLDSMGVGAVGFRMRATGMGGGRGKGRRGGRPRGRTVDVIMTFRFPADLVTRLREAARREDRAVAQLVRVLLREGLDRLEKS